MEKKGKKGDRPERRKKEEEGGRRKEEKREKSQKGQKRATKLRLGDHEHEVYISKTWNIGRKRQTQKGIFPGKIFFHNPENILVNIGDYLLFRLSPLSRFFP
ncbi:MAG: hypothetical protein KAW12_13705 [Candidatus Aminicenantes bacterium]|nr:hypothetical protein [Candidatus Aminicenantes bacterium]